MQLTVCRDVHADSVAATRCSATSLHWCRDIAHDKGVDMAVGSRPRRRADVAVDIASDGVLAARHMAELAAATASRYPSDPMVQGLLVQAQAVLVSNRHTALVAQSVEVVERLALGQLTGSGSERAHIDDMRVLREARECGLDLSART